MIPPVILLFLLLLSFQNLPADDKPGCTDPHAANFDHDATVNDGSCQYGTSNYQPILVTTLSGQVSETSGLIYWKGMLWTINDSGFGPELYAVDTLTGTVLRKVYIRNASASDWEDIARDGEYVYIGDFGNNNGTRTDLCIYKVELEDLAEDTADAERISFSYPDQTDFSSRPQNHNFDAEAMITVGDSLYIFSKNWANLRTKVYLLPKSPGSYVARLADEMFAGGLVTGADFNTEDSVVVLTAYTKLLQPFMWLLWDFPGTKVLDGNRRKIGFNTLYLHQVEGICHVSGAEYFISNEVLGDIPARLHSVNTSNWIGNVATGINDHTPQRGELELFPNPAGNLVQISWDKTLTPPLRIEVYDLAGNLSFIKTVQQNALTMQLDLSELPDGMFRVILLAGEERLSKNLMILRNK